LLLGQVEDLALVGDADQALEAEGAAEHVLSDALDSGGVAFGQSYIVVDAEARVAPPPHLLDDGLVDLAALAHRAPKRTVAISMSENNSSTSSRRIARAWSAGTVGENACNTNCPQRWCGWQVVPE
jgi:hypothetical protein